MYVFSKLEDKVSKSENTRFFAKKESKERNLEDTKRDRFGVGRVNESTVNSRGKIKGEGEKGRREMKVRDKLAKLKISNFRRIKLVP